ncbi:MAG: hypothetical protein KF731_11215, partial [Thauera sp.]|nr:hypothetical protein [Thauera sp.]
MAEGIKQLPKCVGQLSGDDAAVQGIQVCPEFMRQGRQPDAGDWNGKSSNEELASVAEFVRLRFGFRMAGGGLG